uniref:Uncharacterized protein LOC104247175 n=1 Tax=Nicotiana sylvestris TaxID=4096 RepID=A0A1U7YQD4_NICSY|nr:PREDICTED: uncharacterized protein LOC104247175 [Nicotiana sylvestris]
MLHLLLLASKVVLLVLWENKFLQLDPPVFTCANPEEDPQDFIDEMHKTLRVMRYTETEGVELAAYHLKGVAYSWYEFWEDSMRKGALRRGGEYHMEFAHLSKYSIHMLPIVEARVRRYVQGLSPLVINEAATTALNSDMNYGKMVAFSQATDNRKLKNRMEREGSNKARSTGNLGDLFGGGRSAFRGGSPVPSKSFA